MKIIAVDPGMASCGMVCFEGHKMLNCNAVLTRPEKAVNARGEYTTTKSNSDAIRRSAEVCESIINYIISNNAQSIDAIVIEEFVDIRSAKGGAGLWTTPMAIGYIFANLEREFPDTQIYWQNPSRLPAKSKRERRWNELVDEWNMWRVEDVPKMRKEHIQSAAFHAIYFLEHNRHGREEAITSHRERKSRAQMRMEI